MTGAPQISVIIPSVNGLPMIADTLAALEAQTARSSAEILVLDCTDEATRRTIRERFPAVEVLTFERRLSIPELRARGIARARAEIVVMLEDHCIAPPHWLETMVDCHRRLPHAAIAGAVENGATGSARDWAHYLCEYSGLGAPLAGGEIDAVAGNSTAYKRAALEAVAASDGPPRWEYFLHRDLRRRGFRFWCEPALSVVHRISFASRDLLAQRFHYSRSFAAMRAAEAGGARRFALAAASLFLPPLVLARIVRQVVAKKRHLAELIRAFPWLCLLAIAWGAGEFVGYLAGPGSSLEKVR